MEDGVVVVLIILALVIMYKRDSFTDGARGGRRSRGGVTGAAGPVAPLVPGWDGPMQGIEHAGSDIAFISAHNGWGIDDMKAACNANAKCKSFNWCTTCGWGPNGGGHLKSATEINNRKFAGEFWVKK